MAHHMFAIFSRDVARPPTGLEIIPLDMVHMEQRPKENPFEATPEKEERKLACRKSLDKHYEDCKSPTKRKVELDEGNGFTVEDSPFCHVATRNGISAVFAGEIGAWPGIDAVKLAHDAFVRGEPPSTNNDATWLLDFYETFNLYTAPDVTELALRALSKIQGQFAFVIYDQLHKRVLAARDAEGLEPMYWGVTEDGKFMLGTDINDLTECNPSATHFPAGTMYMSQGDVLAVHPGEMGWIIPHEQWPGKLFAFVESMDHKHWRAVQAIPRVTSKGCICGTVYKVA